MMAINHKVGAVAFILAVIIITATIVRVFSIGSVFFDYSERIELKRRYMSKQIELGNVDNAEAAAKDIIVNLCMYSEIQSTFRRDGLVELFGGVLVGLLCMLPLGVSVRKDPGTE